MSTNPNTVKSQDELNEGGRKSDVLLKTIEKCERLQKQLDIALDCMRVIKRNSSYRDIRHSLIVVAEHKIKELDNDNQAK